MRKKYFKLYTMLFFMLFSGAALAEGFEENAKLAEDRAQKVIEACWEKTIELRSSPVTNDMRAGSWETALCLQDHLKKIVDKVFFVKNTAGAEKAKTQIEDYVFSLGSLYWHLDNENDFCGSGCGTVYHVIPNSRTAKALEYLVHEYYQKVARYSPEYLK